MLTIAAAAVLWVAAISEPALTPTGHRREEGQPRRRSAWVGSTLPSRQLFSAFDFGAAGTGKGNDTAAIQRTLDAAAAAGGGVAWLPSNGTFLIGSGLNAIGHVYDGVTLRIDGAVTVPQPPQAAWSTRAQCGMSTSRRGSGGIQRSLCSVLLVINVDRFTFTGHGSVTGFMFDEHKTPIPAGGGGFRFVNVTNLLVENLRLSHFSGMMWVHFSQHVMVRNVTLFNRNSPEETGDIEVGGMGSHGMPPPLCAWKGGKFRPDDPCLVPGANWQYELDLLRPRNFTMRDSIVNGGDDNVCIKNDTQGVLIENVVFTDGHGASIGSIPDCAGCHGHVSDIVFRRCTFEGNAPMNIKTWHNTTGEIENILFEDIKLNNASMAITISANYGGSGCPCKWMTDYGGPEQRTPCHTYGPGGYCSPNQGRLGAGAAAAAAGNWAAGCVGVGGVCGPVGDTSNNIAIRNITFRRLTGTVQTPGNIACRQGNPCTVNFEDVELKTAKPWECGNAVITSAGTVSPALPKACPVGPTYGKVREASRVKSDDDTLKFKASGVPGGGSFFSPSLHPTLGVQEMWVSSDMSGLYRSADTTNHFTMVPHQDVLGGRSCDVQFGTGSQRYALDKGFIKKGVYGTGRPKASSDRGISWTATTDPTHYQARSLHADPSSVMLFVTSPDTLYGSVTAGAEWSQLFVTPNKTEGLFIAGVHWRGAGYEAIIGTNQGVLVVTHELVTSTMVTRKLDATGIPPSEAIFSFAGASSAVGGTTLYALTANRSLPQFPKWQWDEEGFNHPLALWHSHWNVGTLDWFLCTGNQTCNQLAGAGGSLGLTQVAMASNDPDTVYLAGKDLSRGLPMVLRSTNGGAFVSVLGTNHNRNIAVGWQGDGAAAIFNWGYGAGIYGLDVSALDSQNVVVSNSGSVLFSSSGGEDWVALEILPRERTPPNHSVDQRHSFHSSGLEDDSLWYITWADEQTLFASYTDIKGAISHSGGLSWSFDWTAPNLTSTQNGFNTMFMCVRAPDGLMYAAVSSVHDMYMSTHLTDDTIDNPPSSHPLIGQVLVSSTKGRVWTTLHDIGKPAVWISLDPTNSSRLYVSVANSLVGGIYECGTDADSGCHQLLPQPPRTQGHAWVSAVLPDGMLVASFSARREGMRSGDGVFTSSSGVFALDAAGKSSTWRDVSHPAMTQYTKDIVVCPHDTTASTWYAAVAEGWGKGALPGAGLYKTTNRGKKWVQMALHLPKGGAESIGVSPTNPRSVFVSTEQKGLWHCCGDDPCRMVTSYPFFHPLRILFPPNATKDDSMFVTSFGGGLMTGTGWADMCL